MEAPQTIYSSSYNTAEEYIKEANKFVSNILMQELKKLSISSDELNSRNAVERYQIGKHSSNAENEIHEIYSAFGITLVEVLWVPNKLTVSTPKAIINYAEGHKWIEEDMDHILNQYRVSQQSNDSNDSPLSDDLDPTAQN